ncbi:unnamed protein product [Rotaria sordida]|uniref:NHL repeat-containing protein n=1 Tax=Rotaria sordida TaxID=392033 RepID=A0A819G8E5_9BILA|nr:unnamed protein product [Rotaria sordida]CAF1339005.1 unnamed protein product [Rotaria sordida]CAF1365136.1 unnamed protein product [Rotaria sordida]CAF3822249.1 unnamed protein product [Rotaria sordida]CAF3868885.1 unnamed protein product [Rotaria sordida]
MGDYHQVTKQSLDDANTITTIAGTNFAGSASNMLNTPYGIFVDNNFNLYVADCGNNRVQFFLFGESEGTTVAGSEAAISFPLSCPTAVTVDGADYLFIVDSGNNRIIKSSAEGFQCVIGCSTAYGSAADQLASPWTLAFDHQGSIFVADTNNGRLQKFDIATNSCGESNHI